MLTQVKPPQVIVSKFSCSTLVSRETVILATLLGGFKVNYLLPELPLTKLSIAYTLPHLLPDNIYHDYIGDKT
jgi:hypothetical protein